MLHALTVQMFSPSAYMETFGGSETEGVTVTLTASWPLDTEPLMLYHFIHSRRFVIGQKNNFNSCIIIWCWCSEEIAIPKRQACPRVLLRFKWGNHLSHWESLGKGWWGWWTRILVHKILNLNLSPHTTDLAWHLWPVLGWRYGGLDEGNDSKCVER